MPWGNVFNLDSIGSDESVGDNMKCKILAPLLFFLLGSCASTTTKFAASDLKQLDPHAKFGIEEIPDGLLVDLEDSEYFFMPQNNFGMRCMSKLKRIILAEEVKRKRTFLPIDASDHFLFDSARSHLSGVESCSLQVRLIYKTPDSLVEYKENAPERAERSRQAENTRQFKQNEDHLKQQRANATANSLSEFSNSLQNNFGQHQPASLKKNSVTFCRVNSFGHIGGCFMNLDMCRASLLNGDTCIAR